jgi:hypothetical protein
VRSRYFWILPVLVLVLQLKSANVTHVLTLPPVAAEIWLFQSAAEQQHYRPRYGFTSFNLPLSVEENASIVPHSSRSAAWASAGSPTTTRTPHTIPVRYRGASDAWPHWLRGTSGSTAVIVGGALIAVQLCDALYLLRDALSEGKGFTASHLLAGMPIAGQKLTTAGTFAGGLTSTDHGLPGAYRDQQYQTACSCFTYSGPTHCFAR